MFVSKSKYRKLEESLESLEKYYEKQLWHRRYEIRTLERTISSLNTSNVVPYDKIKEGDLVMDKSGNLRKVVKVEGNWALNIIVKESTLEVRTPGEFRCEFRGGPVSKQDLIKYMKDRDYRK